MVHILVKHIILYRTVLKYVRSNFRLIGILLKLVTWYISGAATERAWVHKYHFLFHLPFRWLKYSDNISVLRTKIVNKRGEEMKRYPTSPCSSALKITWERKKLVDNNMFRNDKLQQKLDFNVYCISKTLFLLYWIKLTETGVHKLFRYAAVSSGVEYESTYAPFRK